MGEQEFDIVEQYFQYMIGCKSLSCQKVVFEFNTRREWFFVDDSWCYFEFCCDDGLYRLKKSDDIVFQSFCEIKDMSYEIKMLFAYYLLRGVVTIEKDIFDNYIAKFEKEKISNPMLTIEEFNFDLRYREEVELNRSEKIANGIMAGCFVMASAVILLFLLAIVSYVKMRYF